MLIWQSEFSIIPSHAPDDLLHICKDWVTGSYHNEWESDDLKETPSGYRRFEKGGELVEIIERPDAANAYVGFRYHKIDGQERAWISTVCGWRSPTRFIVTIQLFCECPNAGTLIPPAKKPVLVELLLEKLGGDIDGHFKVSEAPHDLAETDLDLAVSVLQGTLEHSLPIIYVSSTYLNQPALNKHALASWCAGMAHVVVEPSRRFSFLLAARTGRQNPYEGAVAVCWPKGSGIQRRLYPYNYPGQTKFATAIAKTVERSLCTRRPNPNCNWDFLQQLLFSARLEELKAKGEAGIDDYIKAFDAERATQQSKLEDAEREINRLRIELQNSNPIGDVTDGLLNFGTESDLYPGEHRDALIYSLTLARNNAHPDGRIRDIIEALLEANDPAGERERRNNLIRDTLNACQNLGKKEKDILQELGFEIFEDGPHYKLVFAGDDRYTFTAPKTGSDFRGMKNCASQINRLLFK